MAGWRIVVFMAVALGWIAGAEAEYFRRPDSDIDPNVFRIDEEKHLGVRFGREVTLIDERGTEFAFDSLPPLPTILVLSYYVCDGSCSAINNVVKELVSEVKALTLGQGFQVLTLSFDKNDTPAKADAFKRQLRLPAAWDAGWRFALFKDPSRLEEETRRVGYKFFWSAQDQTFFHPTVLLFLTGEGRVSRYLNALGVTSKDVELALLEAKAGKYQIGEVLNYAVNLCYSYNYKEGRYTLNIPLLVGGGSLLLGISLLLGSMLYFRRRHA